jgi:hypothetical protein
MKSMKVTEKVKDKTRLTSCQAEVGSGETPMSEEEKNGDADGDHDAAAKGVLTVGSGVAKDL